MRGHARLAVAFAVGVGVTALALPAIAGLGFTQSTNATSPSVTLSTNGRFIVGSQIGQAGPPPDDGSCSLAPYHVDDIPLQMRWSGTGTATSGPVTTYDLYKGFRGDLTQVLAGTTATSYDYAIGDYDGSCGGTNDNADFRLVGHAAKGDASITVSTDTIQVWQENGYSPSSPTNILAGQTGTWTRTASPGADGGYLLSTTERNASVTYHFSTGAHSIAVVMPTGPTESSFTFDLDGAGGQWVTAGSPTVRDRVVVWKANFARGGDHTLVITNLGKSSEGTPRLDIDAIIVS